MKPITQVIKEFKDTIEILRASNDPEALNAISELARDIYNPDVRLTDWVQELEAYDSKKTSPNKTEQMRAGNLLEGIALASLYGIQGVSSLKSYRSSDAQHDLLVVGNSMFWMSFCDYCHIDRIKRGILVEAKAHRKPVSSLQFSRVCSNIDHTTLIGLVSLGIIFSLRGASGFPNRDAGTVTLRDARLRQAVFYLVTKIPIIVFNIYDIKQLSMPGSLPDIVERKVRELFEQSGQILSKGENHCPIEINLPNHLQEFLPLRNNK